MQSLDHDEVSIHVAAPPAAVYGLVADVTRISEFSPEIIECHWLDGAPPPRSAPALQPATSSLVGLPRSTSPSSQRLIQTD